jgi:hypothetical protein
MKHVFWTALLGLAACSHLSTTPNGPRAAAVETRDVPLTARGSDEAPRHRVLVLPFLDGRLNSSSGLMNVARQTVVRELFKTRQFVVVALEDFPQDPKKFLNEDGDYDLVQVARLASAIGVAAVIEGKVMDIKARRTGDALGLIRELKAQVSAQVRLRIYAGKNGKEILNEMRQAETEASSTRLAERGDITADLSNDPELVKTAVRKAFMGAVPGIIRSVEKLSWEGRVAMVSGERVFLNAGRLSGLQVGDILKVTDEGDDVYDPETGRFIGTAPGRLKGTIEVVSYFGKDGAIAVVHSGSGFQENDRVELY